MLNNQIVIQSKDGDGNILNEGDRVYTYDFDTTIVLGSIHKNIDNPNVSEWYVHYDDGEDCAVLDLSLIFKA